MYRFGLYLNGFNEKKFLSYSNLVTGCYIPPLDPSALRRTCKASLRVVTVCQPGHNIDIMMAPILEDISISSTTAVMKIALDGSNVPKYLDMLVSLGDYLAASAMTDVIGLTGTSFCPFRTMCKQSRATYCLLH